MEQRYIFHLYIQIFFFATWVWCFLFFNIVNQFSIGFRAAHRDFTCRWAWLERLRKDLERLRRDLERLHRVASNNKVDGANAWIP